MKTKIFSTSRDRQCRKRMLTIEQRIAKLRGQLTTDEQIRVDMRMLNHNKRIEA